MCSLTFSSNRERSVPIIHYRFPNIVTFFIDVLPGLPHVKVLVSLIVLVRILHSALVPDIPLHILAVL